MVSVISRMRTTDEEATSRIVGFLERALLDDSPAYMPYAHGEIARCLGTVGDIAGATLAERSGATYDCGASPARRARRRAELVNEGRARRGEAPQS